MTLHVFPQRDEEVTNNNVEDLDLDVVMFYDFYNKISNIRKFPKYKYFHSLKDDLHDIYFRTAVKNRDLDYSIFECFNKRDCSQVTMTASTAFMCATLNELKKTQGKAYKYVELDASYNNEETEKFMQNMSRMFTNYSDANRF